MRIVHDVDYPMQTAASRDGGMVRLFAEAPDGFDEYIELSGSRTHIKAMLKEWLEQLEAM